MKLNYRRTFLIGLAFLSISAFWQLYDGIVSLMLKNTFNFGDALTGFILALDNILAIVLLPLFGTLSDKTRTKYGKRMPYIVIGTAVAVVSMMFLPYADKTQNLTLFLVSLGIVLFAMSTYRSPAVALMPDLTPKPLRSTANAIINLMGAAGVGFALVMTSLLVISKDGKADYTYVFASVAIIMVISIIVLVLTINENKIAAEMADELKDEETDEPAEPGEKQKLPRDVLKSLIFLLASVFLWFFAYNAVSSTYSRYISSVFGITDGGFAKSLLVGTIAAVVSYIPIGIFSSKLGRKKIILIGLISMTAAFTAACFITSYNFMMYIVLFAVGFGWAAINVNSYPMVVEMSKGSDIGRYTGLYYTFSMSAQVATPIISGLLIDNLSIGYRVIFPYAAVFSALAIVTMCFVKHGDSKPAPKKSLLENVGGDD